MKIFHHSIPLFIWSLWVIWLLFFQDKSYTNYVNNLTPVRVQIINSYSGFIQRASGQNIIYFGNNVRTNQNNLTLTISATTWSNFIMSGDVNHLTGQWSGNYELPKVIILDTGDGIKSVQAFFMRVSEPYHSNILDIILDTTPPSLPTILWPINNSILTWIVPFTWTNSSDIGIWLSHYNIHISLDPWFFGETIIPISWNNIDILSSSLPQWTLFWYIEAVDFLWNFIITSPSFFHNGQHSIIDWWNNNSWWWGYGWWRGYSWEYNNSSNQLTGINIYTWKNASWNITEYNTWYDIDQHTWNRIWNHQENNSIKDILLWKFRRLTTSKRWNISIPTLQEWISEHNSAAIQPDAIMYNNLLWLYYYHLNPLWYTMNLISRLLIPIYYLVKWLQYCIFRNKNNHN